MRRTNTTQLRLPPEGRSKPPPLRGGASIPKSKFSISLRDIENIRVVGPLSPRRGVEVASLTGTERLSKGFTRPPSRGGRRVNPFEQLADLRTPFLKRGFEVCDLRRNCPPPPCGGGRTIPSASLTGLPPPVGGRDANLATSAAGEAQALRTREGCDLRTEADP